MLQTASLQLPVRSKVGVRRGPPSRPFRVHATSLELSSLDLPVSGASSLSAFAPISAEGSAEVSFRHLQDRRYYSEVERAPAYEARMDDKTQYPRTTSLFFFS